MSDEIQAVGVMWKAGVAIIGIGGGIIGFFTKRVVDDVRELKNSGASCKLALAEFKAEVANNYAKDVSVQASLSRIHDRLDDGFEELRSDIKSLIARVK